MFSAGENILGKKYQVFRPLAGKWVPNRGQIMVTKLTKEEFPSPCAEAGSKHTSYWTAFRLNGVSVPLRGSGFQTLALTARCLCGFQNPFAAENEFLVFRPVQK